MKLELSIKSNLFILIATIMCTVGGLVGWFDTVTTELIISGILITIIGLPHGATDLLLFKYLSERNDVKSYLKFLGVYLGLIAIYGFVWMFFPSFAMLLFIIISIYHFGQSNWAFLSGNFPFERLLIYLLSGSFVMLTPLCLHYEMTMEVVQGITGIASLSVDYRIIAVLPGVLLILNIWVLFFLLSKGLIDKQELCLQLIGLILLMTVFSTLPLILSFTVYFVFWHSFGSMIDQIKFIRTKTKEFSWWRYFKNAIPITVIAVVFIAVCFGVNSYFDLGYSMIQVFFVILSLFTLPHIILIEQIYGNNGISNQSQLQVIS